MNSKTQRASLLVSIASLLFLGVSLFIITPLASAESVISNSIIISSNGTNHSSVTTIIDGEVVEDWSETSTEPIVYSSVHTSTSSNTSTASSPPDADSEHLQAIITQLQAIISLYVSLLNY